MLICRYENYLHRRLMVMALVILTAVFLSEAPAADIKVWTSDIVSDESAPDTVKELKPVTLVGARNGSFSGKIIVESTSTIKGLKVSAGPLTGKRGVIPVSNIQLRYGKEWDSVYGRNVPKGPDILLESPPQVSPGKKNALLPVWVTANIPKDAAPGNYTGEVNVQTEGTVPVRVKINLEVTDWTLPDPQDYRTWSDFVQSPDTLALEYNVPLWSEQHWKLIDRSFEILSPSGGRTLYVPLICGTNFGNEESMVKWIKKSGNGYDYDYSVLDKYLDSAEKNLGKPKLVIFLVWDICMSERALERGVWGGENETRANREQLLGKGPRVTVINPVTKKTDMQILPRYEDGASMALWKPMFAEVKKRMEKRGLEKDMMLGLMPDLWPNKKEVAFWNEVSGGLAWAIHGHSGAAKDVMIGNKGLYNIADIGYAAFVYNLTFNVNPDKGRLYGWQNPALLTSYIRNSALNTYSACGMRVFPAFNITGGQRGAGRMGADFWPALKNNAGKRGGFSYSRYPENNWRNLDMLNWFLAPGPDGAATTVRLESLKEGIQECEARIFLEDALLDKAKKAKLGADLSKRAQDALDEHHRAMWKTNWSNDEDLSKIGLAGGKRNPDEGLWSALLKSGKNLPSNYFSGEARSIRAAEIKKGEAWFALGWQEREKKLFVLAGEVETKLNLK